MKIHAFMNNGTGTRESPLRYTITSTGACNMQSQEHSISLRQMSIAFNRKAVAEVTKSIADIGRTPGCSPPWESRLAAQQDLGAKLAKCDRDQQSWRE
jgi:hypothetical protein